ncbi:MAG TPA: autotransporter outer membrane beta-barrel domain-containing protein [Stellaceae bacterium]|nr:autotransporter outer membrane beta-barrel domain-containing protein [Stellaceae bacterium]
MLPAVVALLGLAAMPAAAQDCRRNFGGSYTAPHQGFKPDGPFFTTTAFFDFNRNGTFHVGATIDEPGIRVFRVESDSSWWWVGACDIAIDRAAFVGRVSEDGSFVNLATFDEEQLAGTAVRDTAGSAAAAMLRQPGGNPLGPRNVFAQVPLGRLFADMLADRFADRAASLRAGASGFSAGPVPFTSGRGSFADLLQLASTEGGSGLLPADSRIGGFVSGQLAFGDSSFAPDETERPFKAGSATLGLDYRLYPLTAVGLAASYFAGDTRVSGGGTDARGGALSLYGATESGPLFLDGSVSGGLVEYDASRRLVLGGFSSTLSASPSGSFVAFAGNAGYRFEHRSPPGLLRWGPVGELRFNNVSVDGYSETGAASLKARIRGRDETSLQTGIGAEASLDVPTASGVLTPHFRATWRHEFADSTQSAAANFIVAPGLPFRLTSSRLGRDFVAIGAGISGRVDAGFSLTASYAGELGRANQSVHKVSLSARIMF